MCKRASLLFAFCTILAIHIPEISSKSYYFYSEKAELLFVNNSFMQDVSWHFGKINRTFGALNASFTVVQDQTDHKLTGALKAYQFFHNEFRFTGTRIAANLCKIERVNIFNMMDQLKDYGLEIKLCDMKKGRYKLVNFAPDAKNFPDYLPLGKLRVNIALAHENGAELFSLNWDFEVKPTKV